MTTERRLEVVITKRPGETEIEFLKRAVGSDATGIIRDQAVKNKETPAKSPRDR